jgi:hypothetical protein
MSSTDSVVTTKTEVEITPAVDGAPGVLLGHQFNAEIKDAFEKLAAEPDGLNKLREEISGNIPIESLGLIVADYVFGDQLDKTEEDLFLAHQLDETENLQADLINRVDVVYEQSNTVTPDAYLMHVYHRKAGFKPPKDLPYKFCALFVLNGFQAVRVGASHIQKVDQGKLTKIFELAKWVPTIPSNMTVVKLDGGKATIKKKTYRSIVLWMFWTEYPIKTQISTSALEQAIKALPANLQDELKEDIEAGPVEGMSL